MTLIKNIKDWFKYNQFSQGIQNLIRWFPIIWNDRNFDYSYLLTLLSKKLEFKIELFKESKWNNISNVRNMKWCVDLIERLNNDYYALEYTNYIKQQWKFIPTQWDEYGNPTHKIIESKIISNNLNIYFDKYPVLYSKVLKDFKEKNKTINSKVIAREMGIINEKRANNLLFKILKDNIYLWWI